ncbi:hypothetical protein RIF29_28695 [Crotalaria pallida]|uniref:DUF4283 domain-containing protein n=1 Tax=Crotalaria pallida TaxID=3830 RepID=A0AAN9EJU3_CROPI
MLFEPWKLILIVKVVGKKVGFTAFKKKVELAGAKNGAIQLIDVGNDFYFSKCKSLKDYDMALMGRLWLLFNHYILVLPWVPYFKPFEARVDKMVIWYEGLNMICFSCGIYGHSKDWCPQTAMPGIVEGGEGHGGDGTAGAQPREGRRDSSGPWLMVKHHDRTMTMKDNKRPLKGKVSIPKGPKSNNFEI